MSTLPAPNAAATQATWADVNRDVIRTIGMPGDNNRILNVARLLRDKVSAPVLGGIAVNLHGAERTTGDLDIYTDDRRQTAQELEAAGAKWDSSRREHVLDGVPIHTITPEDAKHVVERTSIIDGVRVVSLKDLVAIKLLSGLLDTGPVRASAGADRVDATGLTVADRRDGPLGPAGPGPGPERSGTPWYDAWAFANVTLPDATAGTGSSADCPETRMDLARLETAARLVRDRLVAAGTPVNRRNLAAGLREAGHRVRNDRVGHLLREMAAGVAEPLVVAGLGGADDD